MATQSFNKTVHVCVHCGLVHYLDVSGSVNHALLEILGILSGLRRDMTSVFLFGNQVVEVPFEKLLAGKLETTWGTHFDCVARSILERGFQKAVIVTDGYATLQADLLAQLKRKHLHALSVLFGDGPSAADLEPRSNWKSSAPENALATQTPSSRVAVLRVSQYAT